MIHLTYHIYNQKQMDEIGQGRAMIKNFLGGLLGAAANWK